LFPNIHEKNDGKKQLEGETRHKFKKVDSKNIEKGKTRFQQETTTAKSPHC
jgi:hypothetical protein